MVRSSPRNGLYRGLSLALRTIAFAIGLLGFAGVANAGERIAPRNITTVNVYPYIESAAAECFNHDFTTKDAVVQCLRSRLGTGVREIIPYGRNGIGGIKYVTDGNGTCSQVSGNPIYFDVIRYDVVQITRSSNTITISGIYAMMTYGGKVVYNDSSCQSLYTLNATTTYNISTNSNPGDDDPIDQPEYNCIIPQQHRWKLHDSEAKNGQGGYVMQPFDGFDHSANFGPHWGPNLRPTTVKDLDPNASWFDNSIANDDVFFRLYTSPTDFCRFRIFEIVLEFPQDGVFVMSLQHWPVGNDPYLGKDGGDMAQRAVIQPAKRSNPAVPYGTEKNQVGLAEATRLVSDIMKDSFAKGNAGATGKDGKPLKVTIAADLTQSPLPYHHPSPEKLARDHPDTAQDFDPAKAWKQSETPIDPQTQKKEDLIRLSNDGQTVVKNNERIYTNTIYPKSMVDAGTAPSGGGSDNGSTDRPADGVDGDDAGDAAAKFKACLEDPENCGGEDTELGDDMQGAFAEGMGEAETVAGELLQRALASGRCSGENDPSYCSALASLAALGEYPVNKNEDFVLVDGEFTYSQGSKSTRQQIVVKKEIMDFLWLIGQIMTLGTGIMVTIRGRRL